MLEASDSPIRTVAVIGAGTIGASWAALFLAHGLDVVAHDPAPNAAAFLEGFVKRALLDLKDLGASTPGKLTFLDDPMEAVQWADLIQESATEDEAEKIELITRLDARAAADVVIASSSSFIPRSRLAAKCRQPGRVIIAHPFNPPHLMPLVEIVGSAPDSEPVRRAVTFYRGLGREPVVLSKELFGHIANRLQAAVWREALYLLEHGVADAEDIDRAMRFGPGLRWAIMGPFLTHHLAGGRGGIRHFFKQFGPSISKTWGALGAPNMKENRLKQNVVEGVERMTRGRPLRELETERDQSLKAILSMRTHKHGDGTDR